MSSFASATTAMEPLNLVWIGPGKGIDEQKRAHARKAVVARQTFGSGLQGGVDKSVLIAPGSAAFMFPTDETLLQRVLGNLLKNALEASQPGDAIEISAEELPERFVFWCHNRQPIPRDVQLQLFRRSFSTKGPGRGIGTYSIRLLTERYFGGQVTLSSNLETGTRFELSFPRTIV